MGNIRDTFGYIFARRPKNEGGGIPRLETCAIDRPFELFGRTVIPIPVEHGSLVGCLGYRIGDLAYIPDLKALKPGSRKLLKDLKLLVIDALRDEPVHSTHMILPESIALARELRPQKCYFTHLCHTIHYREDAGRLEEWMGFAWDGLQVSIEL
jgi:phosphoribosyl 1,2-cyclic phosphate phosphodiesterase